MFGAKNCLNPATDKFFYRYIIVAFLLHSNFLSSFFIVENALVRIAQNEKKRTASANHIHYHQKSIVRANLRFFSLFRLCNS